MTPIRASLHSLPIIPKFFGELLTGDIMTTNADIYKMPQLANIQCSRLRTILYPKPSQATGRSPPRTVFSIRFGDRTMPYVNIRIAGALSREQKAKIAAEITDTLERIALKPASYTYISFDELPDENWAIAGKLLDEE